MVPRDTSSSIKQLLASSALVSWRIVWQRGLESPMDSSTRSCHKLNEYHLHPLLPRSKKCQKTEKLTDYMDLHKLIWIIWIYTVYTPVSNLLCHMMLCQGRTRTLAWTVEQTWFIHLKMLGTGRNSWIRTEPALPVGQPALGQQHLPPPELPMASINSVHHLMAGRFVPGLFWLCRSRFRHRVGLLLCRCHDTCVWNGFWTFGKQGDHCVRWWGSPKETLGFSIKIRFYLKHS